MILMKSLQFLQFLVVLHETIRLKKYSTRFSSSRLAFVYLHLLRERERVYFSYASGFQMQNELSLMTVSIVFSRQCYQGRFSR